MSFSTYSQCQTAYYYTYGLLCAGAAQGELPVGQERVPWGMTVPHNSLARYNRQVCARLGSKGKAGVQRGRKTAGCPSFLPPRRAPRIPALRRAQLPAKVQRKTPPPVRGEHAYAVRTPRWVSAAKKGCRPERRSTNVPRVLQIVSAGKIKGRTMKVRPFSYSASCR